MEWIRKPFDNKPGKSGMSVQEDQLLKIANDGGLKISFKTTTQENIWIKVVAEYPEIGTAQKPNAGFPTVATNNIKQRNILNINNPFRLFCYPHMELSQGR